MRNHEVNPGAAPEQGAFGVRNELLSRVDPSLFYDAGSGAGPMLGCTTTLLLNTQAQRLESQHLSLAGTLRNCAGGPTPWGSWITCEETLARAGGALARDHGYPFEVKASLDGLPNRAVALTGMGRFNHEAVAVDPASGVTYRPKTTSRASSIASFPTCLVRLTREEHSRRWLCGTSPRSCPNRS